MMKKLILIGLFVSVGIASMATRTRAADRRDFWLLNATGSRVVAAYVSPHSSPTFRGTNVLSGGDEIVNGDGQLIVFDNSTLRGCYFDIRLYFSDGTHHDFYGSEARAHDGIDLCNLHAIEFEDGGREWHSF